MPAGDFDRPNLPRVASRYPPKRTVRGCACHDRQETSSVGLGSVTSTSRKPLDCSTTVNLKFGNRRASQVGVRPDLHFDKLPRGCGISRALPLTMRTYVLSDMTIEAGKIADRRFRGVRALVTLRRNTPFCVGNQAAHEQREMVPLKPRKDDLRRLIFYRPAEVAWICVTNVMDSSFVRDLRKPQKRFCFRPQVARVPACGACKLPQIE